MFFVLMAEIPTREVRAEEMRLCKVCGRETRHRYEEICFHKTALFVKLFCYRKNYALLCSECNNGEQLTEEVFRRSVKKLMPSKYSSGSRFEFSKQKGVTYCSDCGERIFPDVGYCTSCAVRKPGAVSPPKSVVKSKPASKASLSKNTVSKTSSSTSVSGRQSAGKTRRRKGGRIS
jgi:hypothetical protein